MSSQREGTATVRSAGIADQGPGVNRQQLDARFAGLAQAQRVVADLVKIRDARPDQGIVTFLHRAYNQKNELVASCKRSGLQRKKPAE